MNLGTREIRFKTSLRGPRRVIVTDPWSNTCIFVDTPFFKFPTGWILRKRLDLRGGF